LLFFHKFPYFRCLNCKSFAILIANEFFPCHCSCTYLLLRSTCGTMCFNILNIVLTHKIHSTYTLTGIEELKWCVTPTYSFMIACITGTFQVSACCQCWTPACYTHAVDCRCSTQDCIQRRQVIDGVTAACTQTGIKHPPWDCSCKEALGMSRFMGTVFVSMCIMKLICCTILN